jgi:histidyl-tRNA synthetase
MSDAATNPPSPEGNPPRRKAESTGGDPVNPAGGSASGGGGSGSGGGGSGGKPRTFQAPKGTRDFYPQDLLRRRYIIDTWRRVSLRHGFEEIDGPTFEDSALYTVKSGEGILNELFGAYSGKDPNDTKQVQAGGPPPFALRPEFTPTLARMYAARAKQLPQPTKWFCVSNFFRAERPQRGRLREFWQWNADVLGESENSELDIDTVECLAACFLDCGLSTENLTIAYSNRQACQAFLMDLVGIPSERCDAAFTVLDRKSKMPPEKIAEFAKGLGFTEPECAFFSHGRFPNRPDLDALDKAAMNRLFAEGNTLIQQMQRALATSGLHDWSTLDLTVARGLAYYTGLVFEAVLDGERAVAGGGRYDKLIELFGGPPTPAVGFGMGDVVLTNLLDDRKLMPEGKDLLEATSRPLPTRPDVFVIANEAEDSQAKLVPLVASLRRGVETDKYKQADCKPWSSDRYAQSLGGTPPLHARRSYKATKNIGKLLSEATACHARYALIIENAETGTLKNMDTGEQTKEVPLDKVGTMVAAF